MGGLCPICFDDLTDKVKATPNACDHVFCISCLEKWSKLGSFCPIDRKRYRKIINLNSETALEVKPQKRKRTQILYDFSTICDICQKDNLPDTLLLCDCCDLGFHCQCLSPPLEFVPAGPWFCPTCVSVEKRLKEQKGITKEVEANSEYYSAKRKPRESLTDSTDTENSEDVGNNKGFSSYQETQTDQSLRLKLIRRVDGEWERSPPKTEDSYLKSFSGNTIAHGKTKDTTNEASDIAEDLLPTTPKKINLEKSTSTPFKSAKGNLSKLYSDSLNASSCSSQSSPTGSRNDTARQEILQFSIFESITDVQASQKKILDMTSTLSLISQYSKPNLNNCTICKDVISFSSQKICKICKLKNLKSSNKRTKDFKQHVASLLSQNFASKLSINNGHKPQKLERKSKQSNLERRQNSLIRHLKRIHDSQSQLKFSSSENSNSY